MSQFAYSQNKSNDESAKNCKSNSSTTLKINCLVCVCAHEKTTNKDVTCNPDISNNNNKHNPIETHRNIQKKKKKFTLSKGYAHKFPFPYALCTFHTEYFVPCFGIVYLQRFII